LCWSVVVVIADAPLVAQLQTLRYASVVGIVQKNELQEVGDDSQLEFDLHTEYAYRVGDLDIHGNRVRYSSSTDEAWAKEFVANHPPGSQITVFYDAYNPSLSVLIQGLRERDFFLALFFLPFNLIALALWCVGIAHFFSLDAMFFRVVYGMSVSATATRARARFPEYPPLLITFLTLVIASTPLILLLVLCGWESSIFAVSASWALLISGSAFVYGRLALPTLRGIADLVIDVERKTMSLPRTFGRKDPVVVSLADLTAVEVVSRENKNAEDRAFLYEVVVRWRNAAVPPDEAIVADFVEKPHADWFAGWIGRHAVAAIKRP
jgi:hypothetical protein